MSEVLFRAKYFITHNKSTILSVVGAIGVIGTAVLTADATIKTMCDIHKAEETHEDLTQTEKLSVVKHYIPAVICGVGTVGCIWGANVVNRNSQASLLSACTLVSNRLTKYQQKVEETIGEEENRKILKSLGAEEAEKMYIDHYYGMECFSGVLDNPEAKQKLFYDDFSGRFFVSTIEQVLAAEYTLNRDYVIGYGEVSLHHWYHLLGLSGIRGDEDIGWVATDEGEYWIEFMNVRSKLEDGTPYYRIIMPWAPSRQCLDEKAYFD